MSANGHKERFEELTSLHLDSELTGEEQRELLALIKGDEETAREFLSFVWLDMEVEGWLGAPESDDRMVARVAKSVDAIGRRPAKRLPVVLRFTWPLALAAAVLLAAAGLWWGVTNAERGMRSSERGTVVARVMEASSECRMRNADGKEGPARVGDEVRAGGRIEVGSGKGVKLGLDGKSWVKLSPNSRLTIPESGAAGCSLKLDGGRLLAHVAPRPSGIPLVIYTPQAKVEIKGTRFSLTVEGTGNAPACPPDNREGAGRELGARNNGAESPLNHSEFRVPISALGSTRLGVFQGLVGMMRLSDGKSVDIAAGQYAVAAEGVELVALPLPDDALRLAESEFGQAVRPKAKQGKYGRTLFYDEFDGPLSNWDVVLGTRSGGEISVKDLKPMTGDTSAHARIEKSFAEVRQCREVLESCLVLDTQRGWDQFVGIRSKQAIDAERFVVELRFGFRGKRIPDQRKGDNTSLSMALDAGEDAVVEYEVEGSHEALSASSMEIHRWEFEPAPEKGAGVLLCRHYAGRSGPARRDSEGRPDYSDTWCPFCSSYYVRPASKRMLFGACGPDWDYIIDRVTVREFRDDNVAESKAR